MRSIFRPILLLLLLAAVAVARDAREQQRIDYLIESLGKLEGAVFIRNGTEYKAAEAQQHLRRKLAYGGERIQTAEQFIKYCASQSSMSHKPYQIRFGNGETVDAATYFTQKLKTFDH